MTVKEPQGSQILRDQFAARVLMTAHHSGPRAASLLCALKKGIKGQTDGQAGAQQSLHVTLEDKILYVMLRKIGRGGPPLLPKNRKRLCFPGVWLGAALQHVLGRLLPTKRIFCPVPHAWRDVEEVMGSSASLEGLSRLIPLNTLGAPQAWRGCMPKSSPKGSPPALQLAHLGCCSLLPFACFL